MAWSDIQIKYILYPYATLDAHAATGDKKIYRGLFY